MLGSRGSKSSGVITFFFFAAATAALAEEEDSFPLFFDSLLVDLFALLLLTLAVNDVDDEALLDLLVFLLFSVELDEVDVDLFKVGVSFVEVSEFVFDDFFDFPSTVDSSSVSDISIVSVLLLFLRADDDNPAIVLFDEADEVEDDDDDNDDAVLTVCAVDIEFVPVELDPVAFVVEVVPLPLSDVLDFSFLVFFLRFEILY